jgi:hypothetical protein
LADINADIGGTTNNVVRHVSPNAAVFFVKGFGQEIIAQEVIIADNIKDEKTIASIDVTLTVRNSPGTFTLQLRDPDNIFILEDNPNTEIAALKKNSQAKIYTRVMGEEKKVVEDKKSGHTSGSVTSINKEYQSYPGEYYSWQDYNDWSKGYHIVLEDTKTKQRYPTQFITTEGTVKERWAFDELGNIIYVSLQSSKYTDVPTEEALLAEFGSSSTTKEKKFRISNVDGSLNVTENPLIAHRYYNKELVDGPYRDYNEQGPPGLFPKGKCRVSPMDRVIIFMTPRFDKDGHFNQGDNATYMTPVFTGVVNSAQQGYSDGQHTITVQGEDVTKYLKLSIINVNPALNTGREIAGQYKDEPITIWAHIFLGLTTPEIIRVICLGTESLSGGRRGTLNQKIDGVGFYKLAADKGDLKFYEYNPSTDMPTLEDKMSGVQVTKASFKETLGSLFSNIAVHIYDPYRQGGAIDLEGWRPYALSLGNNWSFYQADFKTRRDIAYKAAEDSFFNFYADRKGHIWFHPYRYDISWILGAKNPKVYIIDNPSIISYGFIEDDSELFTEVQVSTEPSFGMGELNNIGFYTGAIRDDNAMLKYGQRIFVGVNPVINVNVSKSPYVKETEPSINRGMIAASINIFAKSLLKRLLAGKYQGQVTIVGRPEIDPGRPVYIPIRNMIYYVETVEHSFTFGNTFTTTLHLSYGRKPWEFLPELLTFSENDEIYLTDATAFDRRKGTELQGDDTNK